MSPESIVRVTFAGAFVAAIVAWLVWAETAPPGVVSDNRQGLSEKAPSPVVVRSEIPACSQKCEALLRTCEATGDAGASVQELCTESCRETTQAQWDYCLSRDGFCAGFLPCLGER